MMHRCMKYAIATDIKNRIDELIDTLNFVHIDPSRIYCIRSFDAKTRAIARIWGMSPLFHDVARLPVTYIIEVNAQKFDKQTPRDQLKTLVHELMHIPKTFSGALLSHKGRYHAINDHEVEKIIRTIQR